MNRRSFLLGLATVPVAGLAVASPPVVKEKEFIKTVTIRFDRTLVDKRYGMSPLPIQYDEVHELMTRNHLRVQRQFRELMDGLRPDAFVKMETTKK